MTTEQSGSVDQPNLGRRMAKGAAWMVMLRFAVRSIGLINTFILARLLLPEDFGLVALAMVTITLLDTFSEFGFEMALIRDQKATRAHYDTAWTVAVIKGLLVAGLLFAAAEPIAGFFNEPRLADVVRALCVIPLVEGFKNIGVVNFAKNLNFRKEFQLRILRKISAVCVVIPLAIIWRDYWALVVGMISGRCVELVLSYVMSTYRPRPSLVEWHSLFNFGKWLLLRNVVTVVGSRLDRILLGKFLDVKTVGLYNVSFEISNLATTELIWPISRALFPGYSKIADDRERLGKAYLTALSLMLMLAAPVAVGIAVAAEQIIIVMMTEKWLEAVPFITILAMHGVLRMGTSNVPAVLLALNRPHLLTYLAFFHHATRIPLLFGGVIYFGAFGVVWAMVIGAGIALIAYVGTVLRLLRVSVFAVFVAVWRPLVALGVMAATVMAVDAEWAATSSTWMIAAELLAMVAVGVVTYVGVILALWRLSGAPDGAEQQILSVLRARIAKPQAA